MDAVSFQSDRNQESAGLVLSSPLFYYGGWNKHSTSQHHPLNRHVPVSVCVGGLFFYTLLSLSPPSHELLGEPASASLFQMLMTGGSESLKLDH